MGHLVPAVEMAKLLIAREKHLSITVLVMNMNLDSNLRSLSSNANCSSSRLKFINLPRDESALLLLNHNTFFSGFIESQKPQSLRDDFNTDVTDYNDDPESELYVPSYLNSFPAKCLPLIFLDKEGGSTMFLDISKRYRETRGILVNTFQELEAHAMISLSLDEKIPIVYPIGPLLNLNSGISDKEESSGSFNKDQVKEIAQALKDSEFLFLWSLRKPPPKDSWYPSEYENLEDVLPEGFLQKTKGIGMVIGWASQAEILSHHAVGGFVSHCGWNSILESIWFGMPMATWPMYSEQQANAFQLVKDLCMAVDIKMDYKIKGSNTDVIKAEEIEKAIRHLMDPENGIRLKVKDMKEKTRLALKEGGSSYNSVGRFIEQVMGNN
ncbi:hypothetical protein KY290_031538 [Solanum tuberosum]|uniref:Glycosyltransferase n=1 Tax=Solanum tuberosum TaxID=4113 RepID=A0ABQ7U9G7_SOLTU|nr:hypothetical protein KY284_030592 [Solanum tuberosum]KAH0655889.1 hypothetical protein KY285_030771 [Solanum tuberosum]KAH0743545.1 hypothetical protein KY290_031538 [Solanum tuberosum]